MKQKKTNTYSGAKAVTARSLMESHSQLRATPRRRGVSNYLEDSLRALRICARFAATIGLTSVGCQAR